MTIPTKITDSELNETLVSRLPIRPAAASAYGGGRMTGEEIRAAFDRSARLLTARLNEVIALLTEGGYLDLEYRDGVTVGGFLRELDELALEAESALETVEQQETRLDEAEKELDDVRRISEDSHAQSELLRTTLAEMLDAVESLRTRLTFCEEDFSHLSSSLATTTALAEGAVPRSSYQGIYARDFDRDKGLVDRNLKYGPETFKAWYIVQRDETGGISTSTPTKETHVTTKAYNDARYRARMRARIANCKGAYTPTDFTEGAVVRFGGSGLPEEAAGMKVTGGADFFPVGTVCRVTSDLPNAFVTDVYHADYPLLYDVGSGEYALEFTQTERDPASGGESETAFYLNLPSDATATISYREVTDAEPLTLAVNEQTTMSGFGKRTVVFPSAAALGADGECNLLFNGAHTLPLPTVAAGALALTGDEVVNGVFRPRTDRLYALHARAGMGLLVFLTVTAFAPDTGGEG